MNNTLREWVLICVLCLFPLMLGGIIGAGLTKGYWQCEAIEHNAAEWRIDSKTGATSFHWLGND